MIAANLENNTWSIFFYPEKFINNQSIYKRVNHNFKNK